MQVFTKFDRKLHTEEVRELIGTIPYDLKDTNKNRGHFVYVVDGEVAVYCNARHYEDQGYISAPFINKKYENNTEILNTVEDCVKDWLRWKGCSEIQDMPNPVY